MISIMRNDNNDHRTHDKNLNKNLKNISKYPTHSLGKNICHRLEEFKSQKCDADIKTVNMKLKDEQSTVKSNSYNTKSGDTTKKPALKFNLKNPSISKNSKKSLTSCEDNKQINPSDNSISANNNTKSGLHHAKLHFLNSNEDWPVLNPENVSKLNRKFLDRTNNKLEFSKCVNEDSRLTGGGIQPILQNINNKKDKKNDALSLSRKNSTETNNSTKISFKTKNGRKSAHCIKTNNVTHNTTKVAALTHKFDEFIKEINNKENNHIPNIPVNKYKTSNEESIRVLPVPIVDERLLKNNKYLSNFINAKKKTSFVNSIETHNKVSSPITHRKVIRLKSENSLKKKTSIKKKPLENTKPDGVSNAIDETYKENLDTKLESTDNNKSHVKRKPSFKSGQTRHSSSVRATIQKFETGKVHNGTDAVNMTSLIINTLNANKEKNETDNKPKLPEKKLNLLKTKNVVLKDGKPKIKIIRNEPIIKKIVDKEIEKLNTLVNNEDNSNICHNDDVIQNASETKTISPISVMDCDTISIIDIPKTQVKPKTSTIQAKKEFHYDKFSIHNRLHSEKLKFFSSECDSISPSNSTSKMQIILMEDSPDNESSLDNTTLDSSSISGSLNSFEISDDMSKIVNAKMKPNESFLWRSNSKPETITDTEPNNIVSKIDFSDMLDIFMPPKPIEVLYNQSDSSMTSIEVLYPSYKTLLKKADDLIEVKKREIANQLKVDKTSHSLELEAEACNFHVNPENVIVEAINMLAINDIKNIRNEISLMCLEDEEEDEYEPLEPYQADMKESEEPPNIPKINTNYLHAKANCPLPEVPIIFKEIECETDDNDENIYQCLRDVQSSHDDDNCSLHSYEYCHTKLNEVNHDKNDSDDGYEYCKAPKDCTPSDNNTSLKPKPNEYSRFFLSKSDSVTSSVGYEKISSIYEKIPTKSQNETNNSLEEECYADYNCVENIYDTIKSDTISVLNGYEKISDNNQSNTYKQKKFNLKSSLQSLLMNKNIQYDTISNISLSTISSDQKTNSIYGQRSIISLDKPISNAYSQAPSEISLSDRSDDWEDVSDQEKSHKDTKAVLVRERSKGRHSPASWSRKVRNHWNHKKSSDSDYVDSSDGEHLYESVFPQSQKPNINIPQVPLDDDFDSFDSDSESEIYDQKLSGNNTTNNIDHPQLPDPPTSNNIYTLTRFASAAGKKMKQLKKNLTKSTKKKLVTNNEKSSENKQEQMVILPKLENKCDLPNVAVSPKSDNFNIYQNIDKPSMKRIELNTSITDTSQEKNIKNNSLSTENMDFNNINKNGVEGKKPKNKTNTYLSFKSKFRRSLSVVNTPPTSPQSPLQVQNSTFYLDDTNNSYFDSNNRFSHQMELPTDQTTSPATESFENNDSFKNPFDNDIEFNNAAEKKSSPLTVKSNVTKIISMRPSSPPPPPPEDMKRLKKGRKSTNSTTSWYAECGLFNGDKLDPGMNTKERTSSTSWYAEIGLYQASNISTSSGASSTMSGSGTCSTTTAFSSPSTPTPPLGMFNQEPLYQFYNAAKVESVCRDLGSEFDSDNYEEITHYKEINIPKPIARPPPIALIMPPRGPSRTLWCEIPEVKNSSILDTLSPKQRKFQEAKFEIITSEASYLNSLIVLESSYMNHPAFQDEKILTKIDKQLLFGNIKPVKRCSERLMAELEACWQDNIMLSGLCKIIKNHGDKYFHVYVTHCENQVHLNKTMKKLKSDIKFNEILNQLQSQPACQSLSLDSFLLLPMQRVTRFPLLLDAVLKHIDESNEEYSVCVNALTSINNVVCRCNEGARNMERIEEMATLSTQIEFPMHIKEIPIMISGDQMKIQQRWLIRSGELTHLVWRGDDQSKLTFGKKFQKNQIHLFLFTDLLIVTKKKSGEELYTVVDYCKRSLIEMTSSNMLTQLPIKETSGKFIVLLTLLENHEEKTVEMLFSCTSETDRQRWMEAALPPISNNPDERVYEGWDCPQVTAIYSYHTTQPDELMLQPGDIINVNKKMVDGWYQGERIRDGELGWFPGNHTIEIASSHARARNLRQRYRILELSGSYLRKDNKKAMPF